MEIEERFKRNHKKIQKKTRKKQNTYLPGEWRMEMEERVKTLAACSSGVINFGKKQVRERWNKVSLRDEDEHLDGFKRDKKLASLEAGPVKNSV